ncbi:putative ABC transporter ATP-binding protein [[Actinomadura] parvosata subsp. kistnae]|uniref:Sulfate ABC transporter ATP-binding protein n=1 Tax=[Actinomadura] parvosata subsp. kistnae TaxID=1909395 RepID=A0A1U9ZSW5_9ACTN|nr:ABC transporter ATP-binding protein [Nonomuraea sp. ATCC 55076]AQZ61047.1 sulfate ABC transporter ATP-binding protein [Nonomuraea sp. ATCC 55076]SPL87592.1 putative ABC transporter ATP-binding protein [Actinomadura parvosata subsp. kistnae]
MNGIVFDHVSKHYGDVLAVDDLSLTIEPGTTVALLGPNGAGKSTSINLLLGLLKPSRGTITVHGRAPAQAVAAGEMGAMLQDGALIPELTVKETVDLVRGLYPRPLALDDILAMADLTAIAGRRASRLSGGQAQRVRFALAVAGAPRVLLLDEPTAAMDVESRLRFWAAMHDYAAGGRTVLFATHYLEEADEHSDRVIVIARGRLAADGTADQIKADAGGQTVSFSLGAQPAAGLDRLPGVTAVEITDGAAVLHTTDADATLAGLYRGTTLDVRDLRLSSADLEAAFLRLTRES